LAKGKSIQKDLAGLLADDNDSDEEKDPKFSNQTLGANFVLQV